MKIRYLSINDAFYILYGLAMGSVVLDYGINSVIFILLLLVALLVRVKSSKNFKEWMIKPTSTNFFIISFALLCYISIFWSIDVSRSLKGVAVKAPLLLAPLLLAKFPKANKLGVEFLIRLYILMIVFADVTCLIKSAFHYTIYNDSIVFFYHDLSENISLNAIYLSLFNAIALILIHFKRPFKRRTHNIIMMIFVTLMIVLLSSKMIILALICLMVFQLYKSFNSKWRLLMAIPILILAVLSLLRIEFLKTRVDQFLQTDIRRVLVEDDLSGMPSDGISMRALQYRIFLEILQQEPARMVFGYGLKAQRQVLNKYYSKYNILSGDIEGGASGLDFHNQYFCSWLASGILSFLTLVFLMGKLIVKAIQRRDLSMLSIVFLYTICFLTEMYLENQKGVLIFILSLMLVLNFKSSKPHSLAS